MNCHLGNGRCEDSIFFPFLHQTVKFLNTTNCLMASSPHPIITIFVRFINVRPFESGLANKDGPVITLNFLKMSGRQKLLIINMAFCVLHF